MLIAAHRGCSGAAPENTMAAFRQAVDVGADLIELDVRFTRDFQPVVLHDRLLRRTTGGRGAVDKYTADELQQFDAGRWFSMQFAGERIPALSTVLDTLPLGIGIDIEVKTDGDRRRKSVLAHQLHRVVQASDRRRTLVISSFDHRFLRILRRLDPALPLGVLLHPVRDMTRRPSHIARNLQASFIFCSRSFVRRAIVRDAHALNISVGVYTVNRAEDLERLRRFGVDLVFTNFPSAIRMALRDD